MRKRVLSICLASILLMPSPAMAKSVSDLNKNRKGIISEIEEKEGKIKANETEIDKTAAEIVKLDQDLSESEIELTFINSELVKTEEKLVETEVNLGEAFDLRAQQQMGMEERMVYLYKYGSTNYLSIILESKSFFDLVNRSHFVSRMVEFDKLLFDDLHASEVSIENLLFEVVVKKDEIVVLKGQAEKKRHALEEQVALRNTIVKKLTQDNVEQGRQLDILESESENIEKLIKEAEAAAKKRAEQNKSSYNSNYTYDGGKLAWPVQGYVSSNSKYGQRKHPISGKITSHAGEDLRAPYGTNILAADSGTVITASYMNGYGYTVIIDHGGGLSTLYGHNSKLVVSKGDVVSRGQVIAKAGSTGYSTGPHLHFEVRINGKHTDPMPYIK